MNPFIISSEQVGNYQKECVTEPVQQLPKVGHPRVCKSKHSLALALELAGADVIQEQVDVSYASRAR